jgi:hypothetical protein
MPFVFDKLFPTIHSLLNQIASVLIEAHFHLFSVQNLFATVVLQSKETGVERLNFVPGGHFFVTMLEFGSLVPR